MTYGAPDWQAPRWPIRSTMGPNQARYIATAAGAVVSEGTGTLSIDVSTAYNLIVSAITVSSPVSCINYVHVQIDDVTLYWQYWDINGDLFFPANAEPLVAGGGNIKIIVQNNDANTQTLRTSVAGTYEEI